MNKHERLTKEIENIFSSLPEGLKLEWQFYDRSVEFKITEKPIGYSKESEKLLISKLNNIALAFHEDESSKSLNTIVNEQSPKRILFDEFHMIFNKNK